MATPRSTTGTARHARSPGTGRREREAPPTLVLAGAVVLGLGIVLAIVVALTRTNSTSPYLVIGPWVPLVVGLVLLLVGLGQLGGRRGSSRASSPSSGRLAAASGPRRAAPASRIPVQAPEPTTPEG